MRDIQRRAAEDVLHVATPLHLFGPEDIVLLLGQDNELDFDILLSDGTEYDNVSPIDLLPYELVSLKIYIFE